MITAASLVNLFSLLLGGFALELVLRLKKNNKTPYLDYYFYFLVCAVMAGFFDRIISNLVLLIIPTLAAEYESSIYHIFWDLLGFPLTLFTQFFLIASINNLLGIKVSRMAKGFFIALLLLVTALSYAGFFYRLQQTYNPLEQHLWFIYSYAIPALNLTYLAFAYYRSRQVQNQVLSSSKLIILLFWGFLLWNLLSQYGLELGADRHLVVFCYYLALFIPSFFLYRTLRQFSVDGSPPRPG